MYLLADFINPQGTRGFATRLDKISHDLELIEPFKKSIDKLRETKKSAFSSMTVCGRWILIYQANGINDDDTLMHFIDFRVEINSVDNSEIFSQNTINNIITLQNRYHEVFSTKHDTVELSYAESYEKVIKPNFFACDIDDVVLQKAKALGALPAIETLHGNDKVKVALVDEIIKNDDSEITNVYAIIHLGGNDDGDNGFVYLKIYDLLNNADKIDDLQKAIEDVGGKFDRAYLMERFDKAKMN